MEGTGLSTIIGAIGEITPLVGTVFTLMTSNPLLLAFTAVGMVGVGFGIFKMAKGAAKR